ncbi:Lrp/AsnC family transcriptional regulator [Streptomyces sp. GbtcB6]|uniref:Lrp/AsnC family transcriptional regulator n=1 Tax=Streptomyces sp. GbtcB6 TaxID=2824751 RepID=UPI001C30CECB|nr:AsnC family transcriptional regulator [Streptomyces sp. GbtcB6]
MPLPQMDPLDLRVIAALQVNGRASWRSVAQALGEGERTVARRGTRLLESGLVRVVGLENFAETVVVRLRCRPGRAAEAGRALAAREDAVFSCRVTGTDDVVAELQCPAARLAELTGEELPALPGAAAIATDPVLHYYRTAREWRPGLLTPAEAAVLEPAAVPVQGPTPAPVDRTPDERAILRALARDGRLTLEELAALAGVSKATAGRRLEALQSSARLAIRAVVEPAALGFPVEGLLWVRVRPAAMEETARRLLSLPAVRYLAALAGDFPLLVNTAHRSREELQRFLVDSGWAREVDQVRTTLVVESLRRGGADGTDHNSASSLRFGSHEPDPVSL